MAAFCSHSIIEAAIDGPEIWAIGVLFYTVAASQLAAAVFTVNQTGKKAGTIDGCFCLMIGNKNILRFPLIIISVRDTFVDCPLYKFKVLIGDQS